jgi:hypothetical protein
MEIDQSVKVDKHIMTILYSGSMNLNIIMMWLAGGHSGTPLLQGKDAWREAGQRVWKLLVTPRDIVQAFTWQ